MPSKRRRSATSLPEAPLNPNMFEGISPEQMSAFIAQEQEAQRIQALQEFRSTENAANLVSWVHSEYEKANSAREKEKREWVLNLAFYNKMHDATITGKGSILGEGNLYVPPRSARSKTKRVVNRIRSMARTEIAKMTSQPPTISVVPSSADMDDMFAASAGENVYLSVTTRAKLQAEVTKAAFWISITGNGFLKTYWDANREDKDTGVAGDIVIESVSPFHLFVPDIREEDIEKQSFVLNMYAKPLDQLRQFYGAELEGVEISASTVTKETLLDAKYLATDSQERKPDSCMVYEMWVKPGGCKFMPNGGLVTLVDKTIVAYYDQGLPYSHGEYPFAHIGHVPTGKFYRASAIEDLRELNLDYNANVSLIAETRQKMGKPQLLAQRGSIAATKITNEVGLVIEYRPGTPPPTPMPLPELPSYLFQEQERILSDMEDISGQHQVSKGSAPPGVTAATAISFLQERDDSYMAPTFQSLDMGHEKIGKHILTLAVQYWDTPRLVKTAGDDAAFDVRKLQGADIKNGTDLRVERGSTLPESTAARRAMILDLMNTGHIPSEKGLELLELGGSHRILDSLQADKRQAQRENVKMREASVEDITGLAAQWSATAQALEAQSIDPEMPDPDTGIPMEPIAVPVNEWDNHDIHIEIHNLFRKSQAYESLSPEVKELFDKHVKHHEAARQGKALKELMGMLPTDGSVPGIPGQPGEEESQEGPAGTLEGGEPQGAPLEESTDAGQQAQQMTEGL